MADKSKRKGQPRAEEFEAEEFHTIEGPPEEERDLSPAFEEPVAEEARYFIDPQWYEEHGRVFSNVAQGRLCPSCTAKLGTFVEERHPVVDPKTKRVTFEFRKVPYAANPLPVIRDCCSKGRDYITSETPLLEAIFRVFLANGNQPMPLSTVREHLMAYLPDMAVLRSDFPEELLQRLIEGDQRYGLRHHNLPVAV